MTPHFPTGPVLLLVALASGVVLGEAAGPGDARVALATGALGASAALVIARPRTRLVVGLLACALLGTALMQRALHGLVVSPLAAPIEARADVTASLTLLDDPDGSRFSARVLTRVDGFAVIGKRARAAGGRRVLVHASGDAGARVRLLSSGERATVRGWLEPLTDFDSRWRWRHAVATLHMTELLAVGGARGPLDRIANAGRDAVLRGSQHIEPTDRALLAGFLLGDTRGVPEDVTDQFRLAGLTHLTAVSGGNVAFVLALCAPALRRLRLSGRLAAGMAVLVVFGTMTRWEPSVVRAIAMALIGLVAGYLGRPTSGVRALALAAIVLLAIDPFLLHSVGFLLSCGASLGITLLAAPITRRLRGPAWAREVLGVTAAAQVGVAPILIPVFGSMPLVSLPANLVAVPLAAPLTIWSLATGLAGGLVQPVLPQVTSLLTLPTTALLHALRAIAAVASRVPVTIDGRGAWAAIAVGSLIAAAVRSRSLRRDERSDREPGIPASSGAGPERPGARERASGNRVSR